MLPFAANVNEALAQHHEELVEVLYNCIVSQNERKALEGREIVHMARDEISQTIHGLRSIIAEALEGESDERWRHFFETLFPGLRDAGVRLDDLIGMVPLLFCHVARITTLHLPADQRDDAVRWAAEFSYGYAIAVTRVWVPG